MALAEVLADLKSKVGEDIHVSDWLSVTQELVDMFANATGDHQWIHVDQARCAKESPYGTTIAHGYLSPVWSVRWLRQPTPYAPRHNRQSA